MYVRDRYRFKPQLRSTGEDVESRAAPSELEVHTGPCPRAQRERSGGKRARACSHARAHRKRFQCRAPSGVKEETHGTGLHTVRPGC